MVHVHTVKNSGVLVEQGSFIESLFEPLLRRGLPVVRHKVKGKRGSDTPPGSFRLKNSL